jgi:hypothetical protein
MALSLYRSTPVANAFYGTPDVSGLIVESFSVSETTSPTEQKDDQGNIIAVAVPDAVMEITIEGMRTGSFSQTVGGLLSVTMPAGITLGATTIVTGMTRNFASEQFEKISVAARSYKTAMTAGSAT